MNKNILFVDDDLNLLEGYKRNLHAFYEIQIASSAKEGLEKILGGGNFSVVVADMRMPETDGIKFLSMVKDKNPDIVRIMLTGNADLDTAINAVNDGSIFRFLTKPCAVDVIKKNIDAGVEQYRLVTSEKEILEKTLRGAIKILSDILSITNPIAFSRSVRTTKLAVKIAAKLHMKNIFIFEIASLLSHIGCISIPDEIIEKAFTGVELDNKDIVIFYQYAEMGYDLLSKIPRLEEAAKIIYYQEKNFDGTGFPEISIKTEDIPIGSRILKIVHDFDTLTVKNTKKEALEILKNKKNIYDPKILLYLEEVIHEDEKKSGNIGVSDVKISELQEKMILAADVFTKNGKFLLPKGIEVNNYLKERLINYSKNIGVKEPIKVTYF